MKEERFPNTRKPLHGQRLWVVDGGALEPWRRAQQQGFGGQSREIPTWSIGAEQHSPAREASLLTCWGRSQVGSQGEDWGWLRKLSLKELVCHS